MSGILELVGNTPLVELRKIPVNKKVTIYGKLEGNNPGGSVKDRAAYGMIKGAIDRGEIAEGITLIEATSGNTGIALAMIASLFGVPIELVMPEDATRERVSAMEAFGAKVILTPKAGSMEGAIDYANAQVARGGYLMLNQFATRITQPCITKQPALKYGRIPKVRSRILYLPWGLQALLWAYLNT
ncbi:MAG: pyridoxal-phosphate dependent enzyme [Ferruginibacter sp.]